VSVEQFRDDDQDYLTWLSVNAQGYVLDIRQTLTPSDARAHHARCSTITGGVATRQEMLELTVAWFLRTGLSHAGRRECAGMATQRVAGVLRPTGVDMLLTRVPRRSVQAGGGRPWHWRPRLAAVVCLAATAAAAGCSGTAVPAPAHADSQPVWAERSCPARPGWAAITLTSILPGPVVTVRPGAHLVVIVPGWWWGTATGVHPASAGVVAEVCTTVLPGRGRRTVYLAAGPGRTRLSATVQPASDLMMPAWGGEIVVQAARSQRTARKRSYSPSVRSQFWRENSNRYRRVA
jgi:hypothetical protein